MKCLYMHAYYRDKNGYRKITLQHHKNGVYEAILISKCQKTKPKFHINIIDLIHCGFQISNLTFENGFKIVSPDPKNYEKWEW